MEDKEKMKKQGKKGDLAKYRTVMYGKLADMDADILGSKTEEEVIRKSEKKRGYVQACADMELMNAEIADAHVRNVQVLEEKRIKALRNDGIDHPEKAIVCKVKVLGDKTVNVYKCPRCKNPCGPTWKENMTEYKRCGFCGQLVDVREAIKSMGSWGNE